MPTARVLDALQVLVRPPDECTDGEFLQRFLAQQDEAAFAELVRRHGPMVYGACRRILGGGAEADDAFQATFFVFARKARAIRSAHAVASWLHSVAVKVAHKARVQAVKRRVRQMAAAKPEAVPPTTPQADLWAVLDEELAKLPDDLRQAVLACDVGGKSRAQAARDLGWPEGTVAKRLAKAREQLAKRLTRRGISLSATALAAALADGATAAVPGTLFAETARQAAAFAVGRAGSQAVQTLAEAVMRSLKVGVFKMWLLVGLLGSILTGGGLMLASGPGEPGDKKTEPPKADAKPEAAKTGTMWKESFTVDYPGSLPVSVAFSADGKTLLTGDTSGEVMALIFTGDEPLWKWKAKVGGSHAAVAYSADTKQVYATFKDGIRLLDAATGKLGAAIETKDQHPVAEALGEVIETKESKDRHLLTIGVFPDKTIAETHSQSQVILGDARGSFVKSWSDGKLETAGTIELQTAAKGQVSPDPFAVPLAVDPNGRSAIITGPIDGKTNKNVLWAYVCGNYEKDSPGNRLMPGHTATVVSAAWAKEGSTAVTGDADGRVIVWNAKTMKEARRLELGGRVAALAISDDGTHTAAYVLGKRGEVYVWETAKAAKPTNPIHTELREFTMPTSCASLSFAPDGKRLAGCAGDKKWLNRLGELSGKVRVWEAANEPKAQLAPTHLYTKALPKGSSKNFAILDNNSMLMPADKEGAVDFRNVAQGHIQFRLTLGKFSIGAIKLSADRQWLAMERHPPTANNVPENPSANFVADVWDVKTLKRGASIPGCSRILDVGSRRAAVVREAKIEIWDTAPCTLLKTAPFKHTRIDAAAFSPDGKLLAIADANELVLWQWEEDKHERIVLGQRVGALMFSPDGKYLARGPTPGESIPIYDVETRKVARSLDTGTKRSMNVPRMVYTQGGRVLIACDSITFPKEIAVTHRINLWDTASGAIAQQIAVPTGLPAGVDVSPNGRHLAAVIDDGDAGLKLSVWRLDGGKPVAEPGPTPPAAVAPPVKMMWKQEEPITNPQFDVQSVVVSLDGTRFAVGTGSQTWVYDSANRTKQYSVAGGFPKFVDADLFTYEVAVTQFDAVSGKEKGRFRKGSGLPLSDVSAFSPDGKRIAGFDGLDVHVQNVATGLEAVKLAGQSGTGAGSGRIMIVRNVLWSPDGKRIAGFHWGGKGFQGMLTIWDAEQGHRIATRPDAAGTTSPLCKGIAFAPDGRTIAVGGLTGDAEKNSSLTILDAATLKESREPVPIRSRDGGADVTAVAFSPDGSTVAVGVKLHTGKAPLNRIHLYDAKTLELRDTLLPHPDTPPITALAFTPDGRTLITATGSGPFSDAEQREVLHRVMIWRGEPAKEPQSN
ncbi:sigma-70 family RNA polymerase sigma factor [Limnoglobus roseus]|uniref:RNA polymerase sigma factor n=1 Tax=Limnoglobus roseus TaxID=2598579 RepID=A0A5C1A9H8_9BACT|nr:sigma-70 family RNA polymerase sigma factor [Limnoglobus roseus]QEL16019.1 RNA polymerase sigma factor [Limnoglobus roseus]